MKPERLDSRRFMEFCDILDIAIKDEIGVQKMYGDMLKAAKREGISYGDSERIKKIRGDEVKHHGELRTLRKKYCRV